MTLSKKTIELIEKKASLYPKNFCGSGFIASVIKDTLTDPAILASVKGEEWVRVEDGLPEDSLIVLGYNGNYMDTFYYSKRKETWHHSNGNTVDVENGWSITHWKHITPPKTK